MALSILSLGMFSPLAVRIAVRRRGLVTGSAPPVRVAMVNSRISLVKILPRRASVAAFLCLIVAHFECPDMVDPAQKVLLEQYASSCRDSLAIAPQTGKGTRLVNKSSHRIHLARSFVVQNRFPVLAAAYCPGREAGTS